MEKLQYDFDGICMMQFIMWHVKRPLGRLYVERILLPNLKVVDNIIKPHAANYEHAVLYASNNKSIGI